MKSTLILGAGVTGLAAGYASGWPVYEAADAPGGICSSYYVRPGSQERLRQAPADDEAYRFEVGGGPVLHVGHDAHLRSWRPAAADRNPATTPVAVTRAT